MISHSFLADDILLLRAPEPEDTDIMFRWENDSSLWEVGSTVAPYSRQQIWSYIQNYDADIFASRQLRFVIVEKSSNTQVGIIDIFDFDPVNNHAFTGIVIDKTFRNKNYGFKAYRLLSDYARHRLGIHQLASITATDNTACIKLFNKCGFTAIGTYKSWIKTENGFKDALIFQHILD